MKSYICIIFIYHQTVFKYCKTNFIKQAHLDPTFFLSTYKHTILWWKVSHGIYHYNQPILRHPLHPNRGRFHFASFRHNYNRADFPSLSVETFRKNTKKTRAIRNHRNPPAYIYAISPRHSRDFEESIVVCRFHSRRNKNAHNGNFALWIPPRFRAEELHGLLTH